MTTTRKKIEGKSLHKGNRLFSDEKKLITINIKSKNEESIEIEIIGTELSNSPPIESDVQEKDKKLDRKCCFIM